MKILWLTNVPLPEASLLLNEKPNPFGGWLINSSEFLSQQAGMQLSIAFPVDVPNELKALKGCKIKYYSFPRIKNRGIKNHIFLEEIINEVKPEVVHIFGTEYAHTLAMVNVCKCRNIKVVISIQGLVSVIAQHYMACLPNTIQKSFTIRDLIRRDNLIHQRKSFIQRGELEIEALKKVNHVIGRTTWDKACTSQINPNLKYHFCNETLREEFYNHSWDLRNCERYSIFVSQGQYPVKGLHFVLEAMPLILRQFPKTRLYVSGYDITRTGTIKEKLKLSSYGKYLKELIEKNNLKNKVVFTGLLDEKRMCERFLKSNVFVSPSIIENESNSLSEAKILGVPCVASYVGGVTDRINHKIDGFLYQFDATYMLAYYLCEIFEDSNLGLELSRNARARAMKTHDREANGNRLIEIYNKIIEDRF